MDLLTFSVELTKTLIWPLLVVIILLIIRKPLFDLVPYLKKIKLGELEAEFDKTVQDIKNNIDQELILNNNKNSALIPAQDLESMYKLAEIAPNSAVLESWKKVELAAKELISQRGYKIDYNITTPYRLIERVLEKTRIAELKKVKVFAELRKLRNKIAHVEDFEISREQANEYIGLSNSLRTYFLSAAKNKIK